MEKKKVEYKVIALSVGGLGKKIFNLGDTVYDTDFIEGHAELLEKQSFLKKSDEETDSNSPKKNSPKK